MPRRSYPVCAVAECDQGGRMKAPDTMLHRFPTSDSERCKIWVSKCKRDDVNLTNARICSKHFLDTDYEQDMQRADVLGVAPPKRLKSTAVPSVFLFRKIVRNGITPKKQRLEDIDLRRDDASICVMEEAPIASEVNIPDSPTTLQHSIASEMSESKGRVRTRCAVSTCRRPHHDHTVDDDGQRIILHKFPTNPELVRAWFTRIGNKDGVRTSHSYVCSLHFQPSDYKRDLQNELLGIPSRKRNQLNPDAVPSLLLPNLSPSIEQEIQRAARLKEKCERRIRQEYIKQVEEELKTKKAEEAAAFVESLPLIPTTITVTSSSVATKRKSITRTPTPVPSPEPPLPLTVPITQKQKVKDAFRIRVLKFINSPTFTNKIDFPTRAQAEHMLGILRQGRAYKNDSYEQKILAELSQSQQTAIAGSTEIILVRKDTPGKRIFIADDFVDEVWKVHNGRGHAGCSSTLKSLKDKFVYVPTRLVLDYIKECPSCSTNAEIEGDVYAPIVIDDDDEFEEDVEYSVETPAPPQLQDSRTPQSYSTTSADYVHLQLQKQMGTLPITVVTSFPGPLKQCFICGKTSTFTMNWEGEGTDKQFCDLLELRFNKSMGTILANWTSCIPCSAHVRNGISIMKQLNSLEKQLRQNRKKLKEVVRASRIHSKPYTIAESPSLSSKFKTLYSVLSCSVVPASTGMSLSKTKVIEGGGTGARRKQNLHQRETMLEDPGGWASIFEEESQAEEEPRSCYADITLTQSVPTAEDIRNESAKGIPSSQEEEEVTQDRVDHDYITILSPSSPSVKSTKTKRCWVPRNVHYLQCTFDPSCPRRFKTMDTLENHILVQHQGKKRFPCEYVNCGFGFMSVKDLRRHINFKHRNTSHISCGICEKTFQQNESEEVKSHEALHKGKSNPFSCVIGNCEESFKNSVFLKRHVRLHHEGRPHRCTVCGAAFAFRYGLRHHQIIHSEEKPHQCEVCGKSFRSPDKLHVHRQYHFAPQEPNLPCSTCGKMFKMRKYLKRHQRASCPGITGRRPDETRKKTIADEIVKSIEATVREQE